MSIQQYYLLYTESPAIPVAQIIPIFLRYFQMQEPIAIRRYHKPDRSWKLFKQHDAFITDQDPPDLMQGLTTDQTVAIVEQSPAIAINWLRTPLRSHFAINDEMGGSVQPEALGDRWGINGLAAYFGELDLIHEDFPTHTYSLRARTRFRLEFESAWIGKDLELVDRTFWTLPTVVKIRRDFEDVVGPLEQYSWISD